MAKKTIRFFKPKYVSMTVEKQGNFLFYEWNQEHLKLDYILRQDMLKELLNKFNININHYLAQFNLSKAKYYETMKQQDDNPVTNFKIHLIYYQISKDYYYIHNQYVLLKYILNNNLCSVSEYSKISGLSPSRIYQLKSSTTASYQFNTFKKIEHANKECQKKILELLTNTNPKIYQVLSSLELVPFFVKYSQYK